MKITMDDNHIYRVGSVIQPSVTQIIDEAGFIDKTWFTDEACTRGTYVHKAVKLYHKEGLNLNSLDSTIQPYFKAYEDWFKMSGFRPVLVEEPGYEPIYQYCGTADLIGYLNGHLVLIDIKTGMPQRWTGIQTAAYVNIWNNKIDSKPILKRYALQLKPNEKFNLIPFKRRTDIKVFLAALTIHNYKKGRL